MYLSLFDGHYFYDGLVKVCISRGRKTKVDRKVSTVFKREIEWSGTIDHTQEDARASMEAQEVNASTEKLNFNDQRPY